MKQVIIVVALCCAAFAALSYGRGTETQHEKLTPSQEADTYLKNLSRSMRPTPEGKFALAVSADGGTAWRLNTETGAVSYCRTAQNSVLTKNSDGSYTYTPKPADQKNPDKATCVPWVN
jgi:hypothetical protein